MMMVLDSGNPEMADIVDLAESYEGRGHETHKYNVKHLREQHQMRVAQGRKSKVKEDIANGDLQCWSGIVERGKSTSSQGDW